MKKLLILCVLILPVLAFSQDIKYLTPKAGAANGKQGTLPASFIADSIGIQTRDGIAYGTIINHSTTDTLFYQWCWSWADTATYSFIPPQMYKNFRMRDAKGVWLALKRSGSDTGRYTVDNP